jgi:CRP/FNR family transcriptional regulator
VDEGLRRSVAAELRGLYPALAGLGARELDSALARAELLRLPAGMPLFGEGSACRQLPLVLEGSIRVAKCGEGRELQLYRVSPSESCVLTGSCLVGGREYPANGIVESDLRMVVLPQAAFEELLAASTRTDTSSYSLRAILRELNTPVAWP